MLKTRERPFAGAQVGLDEAQALTRVLKTEFALERISVPSPAEVAPAVVQARDVRGIHFFIVDAPADAFKPLAAAVRGRDVLIFNATAADDALRREVCAAQFVHTLPSLAMGMDGLVQYLVSRKWSNLLVFEGPLPADAVMAKAFENSAKNSAHASLHVSTSLAPIRANGKKTIRRCSAPSTAITMLCSWPTTLSTLPAKFLITPSGPTGGRQHRSRSHRLALDLGA